jgi:hypothetical protein
MIRALSCSVFLALIFGAQAARAAENHDDARAALEEGHIAPLDQILSMLHARGVGDVLEVELERHGGR